MFYFSKATGLKPLVLNILHKGKCIVITTCSKLTVPIQSI